MFYRSALCVGAALLTSIPAGALAADVVACDLFDEPAISALVGVKLKSSMNRHKQVANDATISACIFRADRHSVRVTLWEYASETVAATRYEAALDNTKREKTIGNVHIQYMVDGNYGIGDKSYWYQLASEQFGVTVLKSNRVLVVNFQFADRVSGSNTGPRLKHRGRPVFQSALRKL